MENKIMTEEIKRLEYEELLKQANGDPEKVRKIEEIWSGVQAQRSDFKLQGARCDLPIPVELKSVGEALNFINLSSSFDAYQIDAMCAHKEFDKISEILDKYETVYIPNAEKDYSKENITRLFNLKNSPLEEIDMDFIASYVDREVFEKFQFESLKSKLEEYKTSKSKLFSKFGSGKRNLETLESEIIKLRNDLFEKISRSLINNLSNPLGMDIPGLTKFVTNGVEALKDDGKRDKITKQLDELKKVCAQYKRKLPDCKETCESYAKRNQTIYDNAMQEIRVIISPEIQNAEEISEEEEFRHRM